MSTFTIGQTVHHRKFGYRGVVMGVDEAFQGSDEWYDQVARSRPPKDKPWYHVLVHGASHRTYVAERHLEPDVSGTPVEHPEVADFFDRFRGGVYSNSLWS
jgi:heat shock protein HspQ